jgi:MFS family permease
MPNVTYARLLRTNVPFRRLWIGQVVSELGTWFAFIAELGLVRSLSGTALSASLIVAAHFLPYCIVGPAAGALADRLPRRTMMIAADLGRAVLALGFLFATTPDRLWIAYVCAAGLTSLNAFFEAAKNASMPNLAKGDQLLPANALIHAMRFLQLSLGAMLAGLVTEWLGYRAAFAINAASFVVSAFFVSRIAVTALEPDLQALAHRATTSIRSLTADLRLAIVFVWQTPLVFAITAVNFGWALGGGMAQVINDRFGGIIFAEPGQTGDRGVAILNAATGIGLMIGMVVANRIGAWVSARKAVGTFIGWMLVASGLVFALSAAAPNIWVMALVFVVNRAILSAEYAVQDTVLMVALPDGLRGKVHTIDRSIELAIYGLSALVAGLLFTVLEPRAVPLISGLLMALPGAIWLIALSRGRISVGHRALGS